MAYNRFRYYDPKMGMYISQDPIGLAGGILNLYGYVSDTNAWIDTLGLSGKGKSYKKDESGEYSSVRGHHVHAKAAFKSHPKYDPNKGFCIGQEYMEQRNWSHADMTRKQRELFDELAQSGRENTLEEHSRIAVAALQAGGASKEEAIILVQQSSENLSAQGVVNPTNIPWNK